MSRTKKVQVSFAAKQWDVIEQLRGEMGDKDADIIRNIVIAWLAEKSFISNSVKNKGKDGEKE
jgi:hypothetical protein